MIWIIISLVMFFICIGFVIWAWSNRADTESGSTSSSNWLNPSFKLNLPAKLVSSVIQHQVVPTKIVFNGQEFSSPAEMPPDVREAYEQVMTNVLADVDSNGIPDLMESSGTAVFADLRAFSREDPAATLTKLKEMRDAGLITEQEYETKRAEIIARM